MKYPTDIFANACSRLVLVASVGFFILFPFTSFAAVTSVDFFASSGEQSYLSSPSLDAVGLYIVNFDDTAITSVTFEQFQNDDCVTDSLGTSDGFVNPFSGGTWIGYVAVSTGFPFVVRCITATVTGVPGGTYTVSTGVDAFNYALPISTTTISTSTTVINDNPNLNIALGFILFFLSFGGLILIFKRR